jgi:hypothetical protein
MTASPPISPASVARARADAVATTRTTPWFYVGMAVAALVILYAGFAPSFYLRPATKPALALRVVAHAVLFSSWVVLFLVQSVLVPVGRTRLHRRLGMAAGVVAAVMVVSAPRLAFAAARRGAFSVEFLLVILVDLLAFAVFVGAGIYYRRRSETHKRLMLLGTLAILPPAISRWPIAVGHPSVIFAFMLPLLSAAPVYDLIAHRRVNRVSVWGGLALLASGPLRFAVAQSAAWHHLANWLIR